jgi:Toxin SymE, type I toxin-antitoxin system
MADRNSTRVKLAPANTGKRWFTPSTVLEALLERIAAAKKETPPPKHARPKRIKPVRRVTVSAMHGPGTTPETPWIRLCGNWLSYAGFPLNTRLVVLVYKGCLILTPEDDCPDESSASKEAAKA